MKDRIKKYVDHLFSDIYDTKQLSELKEEISSNLLEKVNDFISIGESEDVAFNKAVSNLGDMSELVESLKKASELKYDDKTQLMDRSHVIGYVAASAVLLIGLMAGGIVYLMQKERITALMVSIPFVLIAVPIFIYFGLTQETICDYGMNKKRARFYSIASEILLIGMSAAGIMYLDGQKPFIVLTVFAPFIIGSTAIFIYLGLTEKSRRKMDFRWEKHWVEYYSNPQTATLRESISGVLWMLTIAAFFIGGFNWSWKYSWIVFIFATAIEIVLEPIFELKRKKS